MGWFEKVNSMKHGSMNHGESKVDWYGCVRKEVWVTTLSDD